MSATPNSTPRFVGCTFLDDEAWLGGSPHVESLGRVLFCELSVLAPFTHLLTHSLTHLLDCYEHGIEAMWASFAAVVLSAVFLVVFSREDLFLTR